MRILFVGGGRTLYFLGQTFRAHGHTVTVLNRRREECDRIARRLDVTVVHGDGSDPQALEEAGVRAAEVVLAATGSDADNLVICHLARTRFEVPRAVALVHDPENRALFQELGLDAICTSLTVATLIEQHAALDQIVNLIPAAEGRVLISEVALNGGSPVVGRRLAELTFPADARIAVVVRNGETIIPRGATELRSGDRVLLVALAAARAAAHAALTGRAR